MEGKEKDTMEVVNISMANSYTNANDVVNDRIRLIHIYIFTHYTAHVNRYERMFWFYSGFYS